MTTCESCFASDLSARELLLVQRPPVAVLAYRCPHCTALAELQLVDPLTLRQRSLRKNKMIKHTHTPGRHRSFIRAYVHSSRAGTVYVMLGHEERQGVDYELSVVWHDLSPRQDPAPRVEVFSDAWLAFAELADVFAWLASQHGTSPTPAQFCKALLVMGFEDHTEPAQGQPS